MANMLNKKVVTTIVILLIIGLFGFIYFNKSTTELSTKTNTHVSRRVNARSTADVYFFSQKGCGHCTQALNYIDRNLPNLDMKVIHIESQKGREQFFDFAKKHKINQNSLGTPLISIGDHYILGWGPNSGEQLMQYVEIQKNSKK